MPKRYPKNTQNMSKSCPKDDQKYAQKIVKICLKSALGITHIQQSFINCSVFIKTEEKI